MVPKGFNRLCEIVKDTYNNDSHKRHMFLISLPLLVILVVGLACGWLNLVPGIIGACVLLLLDILATLNQIN